MSQQKEKSGLAKFATPLIILATIIWGSSFVVMKSSVDVLPTFWLLAIRFSFAALVLAVVFIRRWKVLDKQYLIGGTVMGFCLFLAYTFQTFGLEQTTSGKNAFFTAVYCVIVPFLYWFIAKRRPDRFNLIAAFLCIGGIALVFVVVAVEFFLYHLIINLGTGSAVCFFHPDFVRFHAHLSMDQVEVCDNKLRFFQFTLLFLRINRRPVIDHSIDNTVKRTVLRVPSNFNFIARFNTGSLCQ